VYKFNVESLSPLLGFLHLKLKLCAKERYHASMGTFVAFIPLKRALAEAFLTFSSRQSAQHPLTPQLSSNIRSTRSRVSGFNIAVQFLQQTQLRKFHRVG
jgi:hypothetical protein